MTRDETRDFIKKIIDIYPHWKTDNLKELSNRVNAWHEYLKDEDLGYLEKALTEYVRSDNKFAPSLSEMLSLAKKYKPDPRFEGVDYWERRTKSAYPYEWLSEVYRKWYTTDREAQRFYNYLLEGIKAVEVGRVQEKELINLKEILKGYETKKCLMMKKD